MLTGLDAAFLYLETPTAHMHVVATIVLEPASGDGGYSFAQVRQLLRSRLRDIPPFRRRLRSVPFGLARPTWVEDDHFDLENHLHRIALPAPGSPRELAEIVAHVASIPLDRARPLWELWAVEGLEDGAVALLLKVHHAAIDGVAGTDLLMRLLDGEPGAPAGVGARAQAQPEPGPEMAQQLGDALRWSLGQPARFAKVALETGRSAADLLRTSGRPDAEGLPGGALPFTAPPTPFSRAIGSRRTVAFGRAALADAKRVKNAFGTTLNDVVLAACTRSLRRYLSAHACLPDRPLLATVPVSVRTAEEHDQAGNRVSSMFVHLPVQIESPVTQLLEIAQSTRSAKRVQQAFGSDVLEEWAQLAPRALLPLVMGLYSKLKLADRHRPVHNLVVSNVPGPRLPLYFGEARVRAIHPFGPVLEGAGLNISVLSYQDSIDFGAIACRDCVPDPWELAAGFEEGVQTLVDAARKSEKHSA